jgi:hypothetical protein
MTEPHPRYPDSEKGRASKGDRVTKQRDGSLPIWLSITVVLTLLGLLAFNVLVNGPDGYPTSVILGGLLGAYAGVDQLLKRRGDDK